MSNFTILIVFLIIAWVVPALLLTIKLVRFKGIDKVFKRQLILPLWLVPLVGNLVCYFVFARIGKLRQFTENERRQMWAAAPKK